ncbi:MAG: hypothetical protein ABI315_09920 [Bacteroidia bacterium]
MLIVSILLLNIVGYYPIFKIAEWRIQNTVKQQIKKNLSKKDLHLLSFLIDKKNDVKWERKEKEFEYKGELYDVVQSETIGDKINYYCINDIEETLLFSYLDTVISKEVANRSSPIRKNIQDLFKVFSNSICYTNKNTLYNSPQKQQHGHSTHPFLENSYILKKITPPPKQFV